MKKNVKQQSFEVPNITLSFLVEELRGTLEKAFVSKAQDLEQGWIKLKLSTKKGTASLIITPIALFLSEYRLDAKRQSSGFGAFLNSRLKNKRIDSLKQWKNERIIVLEIGGFLLVIELFGEGNSVLLDKDNRIVMQKLKREWGVRSIKKGQLYEFPPERGFNPVQLKEGEFIEMLKNSNTDLIHAIVKGVNIAPIVAEEILHNLKITKTTMAKTLSEKKARELCKKIREMYSTIDVKKEQTTLVEFKGKKTVLPFRPLLAESNCLKEFESVNSAINSLVILGAFPKQGKTEKRASIERTLSEQKKALEKALYSAAQNKKKAEAIYAHYPTLQSAIIAIKNTHEKTKGKKGVMYKRVFGAVRVKNVDFRKSKAVFEIN